MNNITVCLTSCNRFNLLKETLDTFFSTNSYPIERFIITEDSGNLEMKNKILNSYGDKIELIFNEKNLGLYKSIDNMYNVVNTEYIFHCEDDWKFFNNRNFMQQSLDILETQQNIHQVWLRSTQSISSWVIPQSYYTVKNTEYRMMQIPHCGDWCGFSHNPGLRRKSDYVSMFPNGYSEFIIPDKSIVFTEHNCNLHAMKQGYRAAILMQEACDHIGHGQSTYK